MQQKKRLKLRGYTQKAEENIGIRGSMEMDYWEMEKQTRRELGVMEVEVGGMAECLRRYNRMKKTGEEYW